MVIISPIKNQGTSIVQCQPTDAVNDIVYIKDGSVTPYIVEKVNVYDGTTVPGIGIIIKKLSSTIAIVQFSGKLNFSTLLLPGKPYFIGSDSKPSPTPPPKGIGKTYIQSVGVALNNATLQLKLDNTILVQQG